MPDSLPPPPAPPSAAPPAAWTSTPPRTGPAVSWDSLAVWAKVFGLVFVFVGALIIVIVDGLARLCVIQACGTGGLAGDTDALIAAYVLIVLGLGGLAAGAGIRLRYSHPVPAHPPGPEETRLLQSVRIGNGVLLVVSLVLLFWVLTTTFGAFL